MSLENTSSEVLEVGGWGASPHPGLYAALLLVSMGLLTLEISLTRLFSFTIWYHFAYLTISMGLLGFGASGAIVASFPEMFRRRGHAVLTGLVVLAAALTVAALVFFTRVPIQIDDVVNDPGRFSLLLLVYYVAVGLPFLLAGFAVSVPFAAYPRLMGRLYFWDLLGAGLGCLFVVSTVEFFGVPGLIIIAAGLMLAGVAALGVGIGRARSAVGLGLMAVFLVVVAGPVGDALPIRVTDTKRPPTLTAAPGSQDVYTRWTALSRVDAAGWDHPTKFQFWGTAGLMESYNGPWPSVGRITYDGCNGSSIYSFSGSFDDYAMLEHHLLRTPYVIQDRPNVLVIGVGGGIDMMNAIKQGARHVTGVELQPKTVHLLKEELRAFTGGFYHRPDVTLIASEGRHFIRKSDQTFDMIQITAVDTFAAQATGAYVLAEGYLYTVEAMQDYFAHTTEDGLLSLVLGDILYQGSPFPAMGTRLAVIGFRALEAMGVPQPERNLMVVAKAEPGFPRKNQNILVKKSAFTVDEIEAVTTFAKSKGFEILYAPTTDSSVPYLLSEILGDDESRRQAILDADWFRMDAVHDGNPFFYNVAKWQNFSTKKSLMAVMPGSFVGQLVLALMMVQSVVLGSVLILLPLLRGARQGLRAPSVASYLAYFLALGIGFMFIEISFVQSFVLFLGSPTHALSVTIFALLVFSGIGSLISTRFVDCPEWAIRRLMIAVAVLVIGYAFALAGVFGAFLHLHLSSRIVIAVLVQLPMGLVLGMFMPLGVACLSREHPRLVPWAWGVNGIGSVIGTTLAVILAMAWGFTVVAVIAAGLYLTGASLLLRAQRQQQATG
jgi:spermidine synthase